MILYALILQNCGGKFLSFLAKNLQDFAKQILGCYSQILRSGGIVSIFIIDLSKEGEGYV